MDTLEQAFFPSFNNKSLTRPEKQALKAVLDYEKPDEHKKARLRSRIFDWAHHALTDVKSHQVLTWLEEANKLLSGATYPVIEDQVYFSPGEQCLKAITSAIQRASHLVDICVFTISDDRITTQILACYRTGRNVRIITDNEKLYDMGSDIKQLAEAGIPVMVDRTHNHMHHKFAVIDSRIVLTGSYNWTRSAAEYNHENLLVTYSEQAVRQFEKEFNKLWTELDTY